jgi:hypothetical protein
MPACSSYLHPPLTNFDKIKKTSGEQVTLLCSPGIVFAHAGSPADIIILRFLFHQSAASELDAQQASFGRTQQEAHIFEMKVWFFHPLGNFRYTLPYLAQPSPLN